VVFARPVIELSFWKGNCQSRLWVNSGSARWSVGRPVNLNKRTSSRETCAGSSGVEVDKNAPNESLSKRVVFERRRRASADIFCKNNIEMTPLCQLEMAPPGGFAGVSRVTVWLMSDGAAVPGVPAISRSALIFCTCGVIGLDEVDQIVT
jgi:hypothetical protein